MVATRFRKPRSRHWEPREHFDEDGVLVEPEKPVVRPKDAWEVVAARIKSASRARTSLRRTIQAGGFDAMLTLTYRENQTDIRRAWGDFNKFARAVRDAQGVFLYVAVAEQQKRGAWHLHVAVKGWQDLELLRRCWKRAGGDGNIDVRKWHGPVQRMASYMSKYISKSFTQDELNERSHHRYRGSHKLSPEEFTMVQSMDPKEAAAEFRRLFAEAGLVACAVVSSGKPQDMEYFVWGCTWDTG
jgi:hypothetical protein